MSRNVASIAITFSFILWMAAGLGAQSVGPPTIQSFFPNNPIPGLRTPGQLSGSNFIGVTSVTFSGTGITASFQKDPSGSSAFLVLSLAIDAAAEPGPRT